LCGLRYLATEEYSDEILTFLTSNDITIFRYKLQGNKVRIGTVWHGSMVSGAHTYGGARAQEPFVELPPAEIASALVHVLGTARVRGWWGQRACLTQPLQTSGTTLFWCIATRARSAPPTRGAPRLPFH
jgi:hypothetical protein